MRSVQEQEGKTVRTGGKQEMLCKPMVMVGRVNIPGGGVGSRSRRRGVNDVMKVGCKLPNMAVIAIEARMNGFILLLWLCG